MIATAEPRTAASIPALLECVLQESGLGPGVDASASLQYLRRKPGRGLVAVLGTPARASAGWLCATVSEAALAGFGVRSGHGVSVRVFPDDPAMPALPSCCSPARGEPAFMALEAAAGVLLGDSACEVLSVRAEPVRYKPASRCVIRYRLNVRDESGGQLDLAMYGKVYAARERAMRVHLAAQHIWMSSAVSGLVPSPLAVDERLGLVLAEAADGAAVSGARALRFPRDEQAWISSFEAAARAGSALASFHRSGVEAGEGLRGEVHRGSEEAARVRDRIALLAGWTPAVAHDVGALAAPLARALAGSDGAPAVAVHGSFKPSQLLFTPTRVVITDLDACHAGDAASDVGCFLAYLHPSRMWLGERRSREWYELAAGEFTAAYARAIGLPSAELAAMRRRADLHEAASLLKIATRRAHRLNSPRPLELRRIVAEASARLEAATAS